MYIEHVYVCLVAPLVIAIGLLKGQTRRFVLFFTIGLTACLLSGYVNSFLTSALSMDAVEASYKLVPIVEENIKALPVLLYLILRPTGRDDLSANALGVALGFATLENCFFIVRYGLSGLGLALVRGISTGVMHAICASILAYGLTFLRRQGTIMVLGVFSILCATATFHATYNLLVSASQMPWLQTAGYLMPILAAGALLLANEGSASSPFGKEVHTHENENE